MREFRGKRIDNGEWIKGGIYFQKSDDVKDEAVYIIGGSLNDVGCAYPVYPESVGQYTGLSDKNGKRIFEGDICRKYSNYSGKNIYFPIVFELGLFYAKYSDTAGLPLCDICENAEVIGNIHDNPELLKGGEADV